VEHRFLEADGSWSTEIKDSPDEVIELSGIDINLQIGEVYEGVEMGGLRPSQP